MQVTQQQLELIRSELSHTFQSAECEGRANKLATAGMTLLGYNDALRINVRVTANTRKDVLAVHSTVKVTLVDEELFLQIVNTDDALFAPEMDLTQYVVTVCTDEFTAILETLEDLVKDIDE